MSALAIGIGLSAVGGILGYGAAKDQQRDLERAGDFAFGGAMADASQTKSDLQAQRIRDRRAIRSSTEEAAVAAGAMTGNVSALRAVGNERAIGAAELARSIARDRFVVQRMRDNAEMQRMNIQSQANAAGSQATASLINAGTNIAMFGMA